MKKNIYKNKDYTLLFSIILLVLFGLVVLYSASSYIRSDPLYFVKRQIIFILLGTLISFILYFIDYRKFLNKYFVFISYFGATLLSIAVIFLGDARYGQRRWFKIGAFALQPSEFVKLMIVLVISYIVLKQRKLIDTIKGQLFLALILGIPIFAVTKTNLSSGVILFLMCYISTFVMAKERRLHYVAFFVIALIVLASIFLKEIPFLAAYRQMRILVWKDPTKYSTEGGYQVLQALYAIGSGGIRGKGLGQSLQKFHLPEPHNDMIFAILVEELGFIGAISLIVIYIFIIYRLFMIINEANDLAGIMIVFLVMLQISIQVILNIAVVSNTIPNTGIGLPFVSYGGSAIISLSVELGLVFSVAKRVGRINYER